MSERKVLNKYYPPDFDPSKIPRARQSKNRQFTVRLMAPCNMRCNTCGEYIYKGKKFNARKEDVENDTYLGIRIYRFYIKCTRCLAEISFKTDPQSTDYIIEAGATRNFMALKLAEEQAEREEKAEREDDATNPMKMLEKRTQASRDEMAVLEALEELKELNRRQVTPDYDTMLTKYDTLRAEEAQRKEEENEQFIISAISEEEKVLIKRIYEEPDSSDEDETSNVKKPRFDAKNPTNILTIDGSSTINGSTPTFMTKLKAKAKDQSIGIMKINKQTLVRKKVSQLSSSSIVSGDPSPKPCSVEASKTLPKTPEKGNALSLLGGYGSGDSDSD